VAYNVILVFFLTLLGLKMLLIIPVVFRNFDILLFVNSIYLTIHLAELQLFVTRSHTTQTKDFIFSVL
jgi:hypothetical protein